MKELGIIGYGSMGSMLVDRVASSGVVKSSDILLSTRTVSKADPLRATWPELEITDRNSEAAKKCKRIVLCVRPMDVKPVLDEIRKHLREDTHIISIAACVTLADFGKIHRGKVTKVIPSLTSGVNEGISLVCHNDKIRVEDSAYVERLFSQFSAVKIIKEQDFEAAADLTSCAPGLIASIFQEFVEAGLRHSGLTREEAEDMVVKTLFGTAKLLKDRGMNFEETIWRVATKGGITEEGVKALRGGLPGVFDEMFRRTLDKHEERKSAIREQFGAKTGNSSQKPDSETETLAIRKVLARDCDEIVSIFNYYVENSFAAYPEKPLDNRLFDFLKTIIYGDVFFVLETGEKKVIGFGFLKKYHPYPAFNRTAEVGYFLLPEFTGRGLGARLLEVLEKEARSMGVDNLLANISSRNAQSLGFHKKNGFRECGRFEKILTKFGQDVDIVWMQKFISS